MREQGKGARFRKRWEADVGAEVTPPSAAIVLAAEVLMHAPALAPENVREVMELPAIKRTSGSSAQRSHSSGCLHTQEEH